MNASRPTFELRNEMIAAVERGLRDVTAELDAPPHNEMAKMVDFHFGWEEGDAPRHGKRVRPLLCLLVCTAAGGSWQDAVPAAVAIELIHNFSLIHDDIEDDSETRRGRPSLWVQWGLPQALNTGDALLILSRIAGHRLLEGAVPEKRAITVFRTLDEACLQLTIGQHLDLAFEARSDVTEDEYLAMIRGKTSALLVASTAIGAQLAGAGKRALDAYAAFGHHLGMAFQIQDDILGIWGEPARTGKPAGDDLIAHKKTLPVVFGLASSPQFRASWEGQGADDNGVDAQREALEAAGALDHARELATEHTELALEKLEAADPEGPAGAELRTLAADLLGRDH